MADMGFNFVSTIERTTEGSIWPREYDEHHIRFVLDKKIEYIASKINAPIDFLCQKVGETVIRFCVLYFGLSRDQWVVEVLPDSLDVTVKPVEGVTFDIKKVSKAIAEKHTITTLLQYRKKESS